MDIMQPGASPPVRAGGSSGTLRRQEAEPAAGGENHPFEDLYDRLEKQSDNVSGRMKKFADDIELHNARYNKLNKNLTRLMFGVFTPSMFAAMLIPGAQVIGMSVFLTTAAVMGGMAYFRSQQEKEIRADYASLSEAAQEKKAIELQKSQLREVRDMADAVKSNENAGKAVDDIDDLFIEIDGVKLQKRQKLINDLRGILKH